VRRSVECVVCGCSFDHTVCPECVDAENHDMNKKVLLKIQRALDVNTGAEEARGLLEEAARLLR